MRINHKNGTYGFRIKRQSNDGGPPPGTFDEIDDSTWLSGYENTLMSAVRMIRGVLPEMRRKQSGTILTVTSSSIKEPIDNLFL